MTTEEINQELINRALFESLSNLYSNNDEIVYYSTGNPFSIRPHRRLNSEIRYIVCGNKVPAKSKVRSDETEAFEIHILFFEKIDIEWMRNMLRINFIDEQPKVIWWFSEKNIELKEVLLDILGEYRSFQISDDLMPKVSFFIEEKKKVFFKDFNETV